MLALDIRKLKKLGYLDALHPFTLRWWMNGNQIGAIGLSMSEFWMELDYKHRDESMNYKVRFDWTDCYLGKGV